MRRREVLAAGLVAPMVAPAVSYAMPPPAPMTHRGWTRTEGGRGGQVLRVTTLAADGPGSLRAALSAKGPRIVVFEVGGIIDHDRQSLRVTQPFLTIAGQTAPSPGITLIRGGLTIATHDVVVQHLRVRPGEAGQAKASGWECDGISAMRGLDVVVDQCSCSWATDENLSASGPRFDGASPDAWREATSHRITFTNNIVAEGLSRATHSKGEHSKGGLIHDNVTGVLIAGNLYAHNRERNPLFKGGARGAVVNNLIYDPGKRGVHFNLHAREWEGQPFQNAQVSVVGNVLKGGPSTDPAVAMMMIGGEGPIDLYLDDNLAHDAGGRALPRIGWFGGSSVRPGLQARPVAWPEGLIARPAGGVVEAVLANAGARPWDRDVVDARIVAEVRAGTGRIIDSETEVGGYPQAAATRQAFDPSAWVLDGPEVRRR